MTRLPFSDNQASVKLRSEASFEVQHISNVPSAQIGHSAW